MDNYDFCRNDLNEITREYMYNVGLIAMGCGISSVAPLGFSGDTYFMFGKSEV